MNRRPPPLLARGSLQGLVGNRVGEDFFVSLVELGSGVAGIVHGDRLLHFVRRRGRGSAAMSAVSSNCLRSAAKKGPRNSTTFNMSRPPPLHARGSLHG